MQRRIMRALYGSGWRCTMLARGLLAGDDSSAETMTCPKCNSQDITANQKGFSPGKAILGGALVGAIGLLGGFFGKRKLIITCLRCGHEWRPGVLNRLPRRGDPGICNDCRNAPAVRGGICLQCEVKYRPAPLSKQSDDRTCPYCAEIIKTEAKICRFCNHDVTDGSTLQGHRRVRCPACGGSGAGGAGAPSPRDSCQRCAGSGWLTAAW